ncbi:MAG: NADP-dependent 3-hydroxy acid dehydrogenase YdfG [Chloroflexi bacterium]|nr:NADP-dependent 3-hydroxy acid dehydrogenase YdfG [Chloroflexota bacterium]
MPAPVMIITGASSGIGAATAQLFAAKGYRVVLAARRLERLRTLEKEIKEAGGEAISIQTDVSQLSQLENLFEETLEQYGQIDILVNNAGFGRLMWLDDQDPEEDIAAQIRVNITGVIQASRLVLPHMIEREQGHIINMASVGGWIAPPTYSVYSATKYALRGFGEGLRREVKAMGVRVSTLYPGAVMTEFGQHAGVKWETEVTTPNWLLLSAEDVARSVFRIVKTGRRNLVIPRIMHVAIWFNAHFPWLIDWILSKYFHRKEGASTEWGVGDG